MPTIKYSENLDIDIGLPEAIFENEVLTPRDIERIAGWLSNVQTATTKLHIAADDAGFPKSEVRVWAYDDHSFITVRAEQDLELAELDPNGIPGARPAPDADEILRRINPAGLGTHDVELGRVMNKLDAAGVDYTVVEDPAVGFDPEVEQGFYLPEPGVPYSDQLGRFGAREFELPEILMDVQGEVPPLLPEDIAGQMRGIFAAGLDPARKLKHMDFDGEPDTGLVYYGPEGFEVTNGAIKDAIDAKLDDEGWNGHDIEDAPYIVGPSPRDIRLAKLKADVDAKEEATLCGCDRPGEHQVDSPARAAVEGAAEFEIIPEALASAEFSGATRSFPLTAEGIAGIDDEIEAMDYDEAMSYSDQDCDCGDIQNHARADRALASKLGPAGWEYANGSGKIPTTPERDQIERLQNSQVTLRAQLIEIEDAIQRIRYPENKR